MNDTSSPTPWMSRWSRDQVRAMLLEQYNDFWLRDPGIEREQLQQVLDAANLPHAVIISGLRRVGKSTLLAQVAHRLGEGGFYYLNFEDERFLEFRAEDANDLFRSLVEIFGDLKTFILDEIQNIPGWERFVRRFMDLGYKFYITGSNASLLSRELGTHLTGRYVPIELFPFSFPEYLRFLQVELPDRDAWTTIARAGYQSRLNDYLRVGGIPEPLKYPQLKLHQTLYNDVLYRDIAARYQLGDLRALKELAFTLMSNPAALVSYNKLKEQLRLGSVNTVKSYVEYLEDSWLLFTVNRYDFSVRKQQQAPKKIYGIDTGLLNSIGFAFSPNLGKQLENLVFLALRRQTNDLYYFNTKSGYEVDLYLPRQRLLIQVSQDMHQPATYEREVRAISEAMREVPESRGIILTEDSGQDVEANGQRIRILSLLDWLLEGSPLGE